MITRDFKSAAGRRFDLIVVGGGIYGAMLALEAARRGLSPMLLERSDFGGATSWNSLRIVHGGLRYLQTLDVKRLFESVAERSWFLANFPDLVEPLPCLMPLYGDGLKKPPVFRLALLLNDLLSRMSDGTDNGARALPGGRILSAPETVAYCPMLEKEGLRGGGLWHDGYMRSSTRLLMEILHWSCEAGAVCLNYSDARRLLTENGQVRGIQATDTLTEKSFAIEAPVVVNCGGPWSTENAARFHTELPALFPPSLAFNLLIDRRPLSRAALAVSPRDHTKATYFLLPWEDKMIAGTWHAPCDGSGKSIPQPAAIRSFLDHLNRAISGLNLDESHVLRVYSGHLPAVAQGDTKLAVREKIVDHAAMGGPTGLFSVSGVKFTTARLVAEKTLRTIFRKKGLPPYGSLKRPPAVRHLSFARFKELLRSDSAGAEAYVRRLLDEESVIFLDDLLLRRTDWGANPQNGREVESDLRRFLDVDDERKIALQGNRNSLATEVL